MTIKQVKRWTIICDGCNLAYSYGDIEESNWDKKKDAIEYFADNEEFWTRKSKRHYCEECSDKRAEE